MRKLFLISLFLISNIAARVEVAIPGISVHFGNGPKEAPRKIDENGIFVFNPGIGVGYDFRTDPKTTGFSILLSSIYFRDCSDRHMVALGGGVRGRLMATNNVSFDLNVLPSLGWVEGSGFGFLPVVTAGANYHMYDRFTLGLTFAFVPAFNDQQSNLGFFVVNLAF